MAEKLKGSLAFIICQFLVIYMLYYIDRSENSPIIFLYVFYFLGGCGIINLPKNWVIRKHFGEDFYMRLLPVL